MVSLIKTDFKFIENYKQNFTASVVGARQSALSSSGFFVVGKLKSWIKSDNNWKPTSQISRHFRKRFTVNENLGNNSIPFSDSSSIPPVFNRIADNLNYSIKNRKDGANVVTIVSENPKNFFKANPHESGKKAGQASERILNSDSYLSQVIIDNSQRRSFRVTDRARRLMSLTYRVNKRKAIFFKKSTTFVDIPERKLIEPVFERNDSKIHSHFKFEFSSSFKRNKIRNGI